MTKLLYDLGQYEDVDLVVYEVPEYLVRDFRKLTGNPLAIGEFKTVARKVDLLKYLRSLLTKLPDNPKDFFAKNWDRRRRDAAEGLASLRSMRVTFSASVYTDPSEYLGQKEYVAQCMKTYRKDKNRNKLIGKMLAVLEISE